jgi:hypothetical protein
MEKRQLVAAILTALFVMALVALAGSQVPAGLGLGQFPNRWIPAKLRRWLLGEAEPRPTR